MIYRIKIDNQNKQHELSEEIIGYGIEIDHKLYPVVSFNKEYLFVEGDPLALFIPYDLKHCSAILIYNEDDSLNKIKLKNNTPYDKLAPLDWDVQLPSGRKLDVYYDETILPSEYFACKKGEKPSQENLEPFTGPNCCWEFRIKDTSTCAAYGYTHIYIGSIYRNDEEFYATTSPDYRECLSKTLNIMEKIKESPACLFRGNYNKKLIGEKIWYKNEPAIINDADKAYIYIKADYEDGSNFDDNLGVKRIIVFDEAIKWFRK